MQKKIFLRHFVLEIQKETRMTFSAFIFHLHKIQSVGRQQAILNCIIRQKLANLPEKHRNLISLLRMKHEK